MIRSVVAAIAVLICPLPSPNLAHSQDAPQTPKRRVAAQPKSPLDTERVHLPPPGWEYVGTSSQKLAYFYNERTLERDDGVVRVWIREVPVTERSRRWVISVWAKIIKLLGPDGPDPLLHPKIEEFDYEIKRQEFNCARRRSRQGEISLYSKSGEVIASFPPEENWQQINPDSVGEMLLEAVCRG